MFCCEISFAGYGHETGTALLERISFARGKEGRPWPRPTPPERKKCRIMPNNSGRQLFF